MHNYIKKIQIFKKTFYLKKKKTRIRNERITPNFILESCFTTVLNSCDSTFIFLFIVYLITLVYDIWTQLLILMC